ncbi:MAG: GAF domain-containing protein [Cetobacterium sp.]|uniref:GAF domain-containing protein n=1 Tax=Cetobacterium sp. ZWU0022 TaxID=1340502 RepID=UPI000648679E|nr:GAF domain-containing protein [Cetobacterium sp. ZWU0022]
MKRRFFLSIIESFVYCFFIYMIFFELSSYKIDFLTMNIHPLAILIGIMALKYGIYMSLQTVFIASFFYILSYYKLGNDPVVFFLDFKHYKFILIFFFIALSLGRFSDNFRKKIEDLKESNTKLGELLKNQREKNIDLVQINERLKERIVGSKESILTLHQITSSILTKNVEKILTQVIEILIDFLGSDVVSIYIYNKEKNVLRARLKVGNSIIPNFIEVKESSIYSKVLTSKKILEGDAERQEPVYISPILNQGEVVGIINIERLKYGNKEKYLLELFRVISDWINNALVNAFQKAEIEIENNVYIGTRIYNLNYFSYILEEDKKRRKIFGTEYLALEGNNPGISTIELNEKLKGKIRDIDVVGMDSNTIKFLFVNADKNKKHLLMERVSNILPGVEFYEI